MLARCVLREAAEGCCGDLEAPSSFEMSIGLPELDAASMEVAVTGDVGVVASSVEDSASPELRAEALREAELEVCLSVSIHPSARRLSLFTCVILRLHSIMIDSVSEFSNLSGSREFTTQLLITL